MTLRLAAISASASSASGSVTQVQFYAAATLLGAATNSPYSLNWTNTLQTSRSFMARARDNTGNTRISRSLYFLFPFDTDGDGISDFQEILNGSNPYVQDAPSPVPGDTNAPIIYLDEPTDAIPLP